MKGKNVTTSFLPQNEKKVDELDSVIGLPISQTEKTNV